MATTISFVNQKGGVGKTSLTLHASGALAEADKKVLMLDMDQQGNLSTAFFENIETLEYTISSVLREIDNIPIKKAIKKTNYPNIDIVPANSTLRGLESRLASADDSQFYLQDELKDIQEEYDYILIDCPTGLGKPTRLALVASDYSIVPIQCLGEAVDGLGQVINFINQVNSRANPSLKLLGIIVNQYDPRRSIEISFNEIVREQFTDLVFKTEFKRSVKLAEAGTSGVPITYYNTTSNEADATRNFVKEIKTYVQKG